MPKRILVVDDEPAIVDLVGAHLEAEGFEVQRAHAGKVALELLRKHPPDLVFLDLLMPDLGGASVAERMTEELGLGGLPVVFLSGIVGPAERGPSRSNPRQYFLSKPFKREDIREALRHLGF